jgi:Ni/Fe-hydrogenase subunit HybB-like protein
MTARVRALKTGLWLLMGVFAAVSVARFARGLGTTTGLSDAAPWGFWVAFDVMAGVALAAGGFVLAATVYVFRLERYRPLVRPAVLTAFLGYVAVAVGLLYDLGLPWHIWHPAVYPQPHSVLFEVAMCVMLYLTVLMLEFAPVVLEHPRFDRPLLRRVHHALKRATVPLVIAGIMLSTLHQSSLGSLFLIAPFRLHPLWYSPVIWVLFFVSAAGLGLATVTLEALFSAWLLDHRPRMDLLTGLAKVGSVVFLLYTGLRLGDLAVRGRLGLALDGSPLSGVFWLELMLGGLVPGVLLAIPAVRRSPRGLGLSALMAVFGIVGYRFNVCIVSFARPAGMSYFPSWTEIAVSLGIVGGALLAFVFFVERLRVCEGREEERGAKTAALDVRRYDPGSLWPLTPDSLAAPRRYSLAAVLGIALAVAFLPADARRQGTRAMPVSVQSPRIVQGVMLARAGGFGHEFQVASNPAGAGTVWLQLIDGNRNGRLVPFPHDLHVAKLGGDAACLQCHHQNRPYQRNSACGECHRDMYSPTDIFEHAFHVAKLGGNQGCVRCHADAEQAKTRQSSTPCVQCHADMPVAGARIKPPAGGSTGWASSYMNAMHGLCIGCHAERVRTSPAQYPREFAECENCHRDLDDAALRKRQPYAAGPGWASDRRSAPRHAGLALAPR